MEFKPFYYEAETLLTKDFTLQMVVDIGVVDRLERLLGKSMDEIVIEMTTSISVMTKVLWGVTRPNHDDLSMAQVAGILLPGDPAKQQIADTVALTLGDLIRRAFLFDETKPKPRRRAKRS